jgi:flagellar biosynthesis/type III secretory pathway protein FliH
MKSYTVFFGFVFATSLAANGIQYFQNIRTNFLLEVENKRSEINDDMIQELTYNLREKENNIQISRMEGHNEAINSLVHKIDPKENMVSNIWHMGYYRGLEQTDFVGEMKYEQGFSQGYQKGTNENMKAIHTIMKSGDNIKSAIEKFVENQIPQEKPAQNDKPTKEEVKK